MMDEPRSIPPGEDPRSDQAGPADSARLPAEPIPISARPVAVPYYAPGYAGLRVVKRSPQPPVMSVPITLVLLSAVVMVYFCAGGGTYYLMSAHGGFTEALGMQVTVTLTEWLVFLMLPIGLVLAMRADLRMTYSWYRPRLDLMILTLAMALCLVGTIQYAGDLAFLLLAEPYDELLKGFLPTTEERFAEMSRLFDADTLGGLIVAILLAAVTPAICEEHFFRGVIQSSLDKRLPAGVTVVMVSAIFAAFHFEPVGFAALMLIGLAVGLLTTRTGCILYACVIHLINNAVAVLMYNGVTKHIGGGLADAVGSFDSLPIYMIGGAVGILAFLARAPRRYRRRWRDAPDPDDPTVFRPGRWHGLSLWLARRWRVAAVVAMICSVTGLSLDIRDLCEIAAKSTTRPAQGAEPDGDDPDRIHLRQDAPDETPGEPREGSEHLHVDSRPGPVVPFRGGPLSGQPCSALIPCPSP